MSQDTINDNLTTDNDTIEAPFRKSYIIDGKSVMVECWDKEEFKHQKAKTCMVRCYYDNFDKRRKEASAYYKK